MNTKQIARISGKIEGERLDSRVLEEQIQQAVQQGFRNLHIHAFGQHGIGGRLWQTNGDAIRITIDGHPGQRAHHRLGACCR